MLVHRILSFLNDHLSRGDMPPSAPLYPLPEDIDIPDNYVSHTIKTQKALAPLSWSNWSSELNWLNVSILVLTPVLGIIGAFYTKLRWETALFAVFYYYVTGLGLSISLG
jgi:stearoyl-CoA desaturase (Delta-9 desaturase)